MNNDPLREKFLNLISQYAGIPQDEIEDEMYLLKDLSMSEDNLDVLFVRLSVEFSTELHYYREDAPKLSVGGLFKMVVDSLE